MSFITFLGQGSSLTRSYGNLEGSWEIGLGTLGKVSQSYEHTPPTSNGRVRTSSHVGEIKPGRNTRSMMIT